MPTLRAAEQDRRDELYLQTTRLADAEKFSSANELFGNDFGEIESVIHELCHWITLGFTLPRKPSRYSSTRLISSRLAKNRRSANTNEYLTVATEINVMRLLRIGWNKWHTDRLVGFAYGGLFIDLESTGSVKTIKQQFYKLIDNPQVKRWAKRVVKWIRSYG